MGKSDQVYLIHVLRSINQILDYTHGISEKDFYKNHLIQDAVVRNFEIIGEATKQISKSTRDMYPYIEWKKMAGMRDKLIHDYIDVDFTVIWATVQEILPDLKIDIQKILEM